MPRIARRVGIGLAVILGMLALTALGVAWSGWSRGTDLLTQGSAAYAERDWGHAADLARRRLKAVPGDVEALRLLARATARLGRDAQANAMFARLGSGDFAGGRPLSAGQGPRPGRSARGGGAALGDSPGPRARPRRDTRATRDPRHRAEPAR